MTDAAVIVRPVHENPGEQLVPPDFGYADVTETVLRPLFAPATRGWWIGWLVSLALTLLVLISIAWLFLEGVGVWGVNTNVVWAFAIANYVWWGDRQCRHADFVDAFAHASEVARLD